VLLFTDEAACRVRGHSVVSTIARLFADVVVERADQHDQHDQHHTVVVCVRDKVHTAAHIAEVCRALQAVLAHSNVGVAVHGHAALVSELGLCGLHLPSTTTSGALQSARALLPASALLGVSAHPRCVGEVCAIDGVDYATWSPVFSPGSKQDARAPIGVSALRGHHTPILALGGIDHTNAAACLAAGAVGVAAIGAVLSSASPHRALTSLLNACAVRWHPRRSQRPRRHSGHTARQAA
jgi:thiamine-phosphate pyrophosphorylase